MIELQHTGTEDEWGRPIYVDKNSNDVYVDVDMNNDNPNIFSVTMAGEPDIPLSDSRYMIVESIRREDVVAILGVIERILNRSKIGSTVVLLNKLRKLYLSDRKVVEFIDRLLRDGNVNTGDLSTLKGLILDNLQVGLNRVKNVTPVMMFEEFIGSVAEIRTTVSQDDDKFIARADIEIDSKMIKLQLAVVFESDIPTTGVLGPVTYRIENKSGETLHRGLIETPDMVNHKRNVAEAMGEYLIKLISKNGSK